MGQNENYSPVDSISESSEELLQRSKGDIDIYVLCMERDTCSQAYILQRLAVGHKNAAASHKKQMFIFYFILVLF